MFSFLFQANILTLGSFGDGSELKYVSLLNFPLFQNGLLSWHYVAKVLEASGGVDENILDALKSDVETALDECLTWQSSGVYSLSSLVVSKNNTEGE